MCACIFLSLNFLLFNEPLFHLNIQHFSVKFLELTFISMCLFIIVLFMMMRQNFCLLLLSRVEGKIFMMNHIKSDVTHTTPKYFCFRWFFYFRSIFFYFSLLHSRTKWYLLYATWERERVSVNTTKDDERKYNRLRYCIQNISTLDDQFYLVDI